MQEMTRSSLGEYALMQELWGEWSQITFTRESCASGLSRREFCELLIKAGVAGTGLLASRSLENILVSRELTVEQEEFFISQAAAFMQRYGLHPDFENPQFTDPVPVGWSEADLVRSQLGGLDFATVFVSLQNALYPERMRWNILRIEEMLSRTIKPLLSIGMHDEEIVGHPFDPRNESQTLLWMKEWAKSLLPFKDVPIDIRLFYEMQVPSNGYVTYRADDRIERNLHAERFCHLHTCFYQILQEQGLANVRLIICGSSAGGSLLPYIPLEGVGAVGTDIFDFSGGKTNLLSLFNLGLGLRYVEEEVKRTLEDLKQASVLAGTVPMIVCEIGSLTHDVPWLKKVMLEFFAMGGEGVGFFNYNKNYTRRATETDWRMKAETVQMVKSIKENINAKRRLLYPNLTFKRAA